jgi:hypothetical protein
MQATIDLPPLVHFTGVIVIGEHELRLLFEDGTVGDVSFEDEEWTACSNHYETRRVSRR